MRHQTEVAVNVGAVKAAGGDADIAALLEVNGPMSRLRTALAVLKDALSAETGHTTVENTALAEAEHARDALLPAMTAVRAAADVLEGIVADDLWPLPTYQEMLFIL